MNLSTLLDAAAILAEQAGQAILAVYATDFAVTQKEDRSPLTEADNASHHLLSQGLQALTPDWPILSEEGEDIPYAQRAGWERYWLLDPLDGTREFVKRNGEFTVNIALIENHRPILGVVHAPVTGATYFAAEGVGAFKRQAGGAAGPIAARQQPGAGLVIAGSRSHGNDQIGRFMQCLGGQTELRAVGSSLKICLVAEGAADLYPRFGTTSEWDTAAGQCVAEQAGAQVTDMDLRPLRYNTRASLRNPHFIVFAAPPQRWRDCLQQHRGGG
jgi:3'(2'), 5'-bisphosphate nucleotidase